VKYFSVHQSQVIMNTYTSGTVLLVPTHEPPSWEPTIILSRTALAAACLASFFDRPVPMALNNDTQ